MALTKEQREAVVNEVKSWLGTPYVGWSRVKGKRGGADCGQLIYAVYHALGYVPDADLPKDYSLQVAQHRASTEYVDIVLRYCREIPEEEAQPGDLVLWELGHAFAHGAIIVTWPDYVIHAEARHGVSGADGKKCPLLRQARRRFFTLKDEFCQEAK